MADIYELTVCDDDATITHEGDPAPNTEAREGYYTFNATKTIGDVTSDFQAINVGKITEMINNKADRDLKNIESISRIFKEKLNFIIESWSDGYCEQWGDFGGDFSAWTAKTVNFYKTFKDTNYVVFAMSGHSDHTDSPSINVKKPTYFTCVPYNGTNGACWKACGFLAEGQY